MSTLGSTKRTFLVSRGGKQGSDYLHWSATPPNIADFGGGSEIEMVQLGIYSRLLGLSIGIVVVAVCALGGDVRAQTRQPLKARSAQVVDDFNRVDPKWETGEFGHGTGVIVDGRLRVRNEEVSSSSTTIFYDATFDDQIIDVDVTLVGGTDDNWQTITCRESGDDDYYDLGISADGYYLIDIWIDGSRLNKSLGPSPSSDIRTGRNALNKLHVECVGDRLGLWVNGSFVAELTDTNISSGRVGLSVNALGGEFTEVEFDNIRIATP